VHYKGYMRGCKILNCKNGTWFKVRTKNYFCNISVFLSFVIHLPEDGNMSGQNM